MFSDWKPTTFNQVPKDDFTVFFTIGSNGMPSGKFYRKIDPTMAEVVVLYTDRMYPTKQKVKMVPKRKVIVVGKSALRASKEAIVIYLVFRVDSNEELLENPEGWAFGVDTAYRIARGGLGAGRFKIVRRVITQDEKFIDEFIHDELLEYPMPKGVYW